MSMSDIPVLYNQHCCPYGQRVWMALILKGIDFTYVEQNPYHKTPEWLAINPRGLVPALLHRAHSVIESAIILEYIDEEWSDHRNPLIPQNSYEKSIMRLIADVIVKSIITPYNIILKSPQIMEREKAKVRLLEGILQVFGMAGTDGPFIMGSQCGYVDILLAPHVQRIVQVLSTYRGLRIPKCAKFLRFREWWNHIQELQCYKDTAQPRETLLVHYEKYA